jgi:type IV pilus assembly protein PilO
MASRFDVFEKLPIWQVALIWVGAAGLLGVAWYFLYYADAVADRDQAKGAAQAKRDELAELEKKRENFEQRMAEAAAQEKEIQKKMEVLPLTSDSVDHLMSTFGQQGQIAGLAVKDWAPGGEQRMDFYAKMPVEVEAEGTWHQTGEFFRRISELRQIVSIEGLELKPMRGAASGEVGGSPRLSVKFSAAAYRYLSEKERTAGGTGEKKTRRKKQ